MLEGFSDRFLRWYNLHTFSWRESVTILDTIADILDTLGLAESIILALTPVLAVPMLLINLQLSLPLSMCFRWGFSSSFQVLVKFECWLLMAIGCALVFKTWHSILERVKPLAERMFRMDVFYIVQVMCTIFVLASFHVGFRATFEFRLTFEVRLLLIFAFVVACFATIRLAVLLALMLGHGVRVLVMYEPLLVLRPPPLWDALMRGWLR